MIPQIKKTWYIFAFLCALPVTLFHISCNKDNTPSGTRTICVTCANGGNCINDTCRCAIGYEGLTCETLSRAKFNGTWLVTENGSLTGSRKYPVTIESNYSYPPDPTKVNIINFYSFSDIIANINGDSIFIPLQYFYNTINYDIDMVKGAGYIHSELTTGNFSGITIRYAVTDTNSWITDDFGYINTNTQPSQWKLN